MAELDKLRNEIRRTRRLLQGLETYLQMAEQEQAKAANACGAIPRISKGQWNAAIGSKPQKLGCIVDKVMQRLAIEPLHRRRIVQRCVVYLNVAVKSREVVKQGAQRHQTYRLR